MEKVFVVLLLESEIIGGLVETFITVKKSRESAIDFASKHEDCKDKKILTKEEKEKLRMGEYDEFYGIEKFYGIEIREIEID